MFSPRKLHLLTLAALLVLVVASCLLEQVEARRSRTKSSSRRRPKGVHIEIFRPKGVLIWYPYRPGLELFGIELSINPGRTELATERCDICLNTTDVSYGKFILRSEDVIIRSRDHVFYNAIIQETNGKTHIARSQDFYVSEKRILNGDISGSETNRDVSALESLPVNPAPKDDASLLEEEVKLLEDILNELNQRCHATSNQTKLLLLNVETPARYDAKALYEFTISELTSKLPTIPWNQTLVDAYYGPIGIMFEVNTIVEKLKILRMARKLSGQSIEDVDGLWTEIDEMSNEIDSWALL